MKFTHKWHKKYDNLDEPFRFLIFMLVIAIPLSVFLYALPGIWAPWIGIVIAVVLIVDRYRYLTRKR